MIVFPFYLCFSFKFRNLLEKRRKNSFYVSTRPIRTLDPWNRRNANAVIEKAAILIASTNTPARYKETWRNILNKYKQRIILDAGKLREKHPNCIPVTVDKDARSDIHDIDTKKCIGCLQSMRKIRMKMDFFTSPTVEKRVCGSNEEQQEFS
ncbi:uncharacterized protein LOC117626758 [Prunus dulcis]|uniref:uncharacterized protein LOC117624200 n=1 Tax=Prunus dulcis TaxID=3755 RepID=UPI0014830513|nr:uncharacterized protein LOC117624200 [Prunus dulcis]XP_034214481.1 uncharacterized protein LOC117626758 [Prunus dulcis]